MESIGIDWFSTNNFETDLTKLAILLLILKLDDGRELEMYF